MSATSSETGENPRRGRSHAVVTAVLGVVLSFFGPGCHETDPGGDGGGDGDGVTVAQVRPSPFWRSTLRVPSDEFIVGETDVRWVKFTVLATDLTQVYFQDGRKYVFHYDFARAHIPGFEDLTTEEFAAVSLKAAGQRVHVGAVLLPARGSVAEVGVQLLRHDAYSKEEVEALFDLVVSKLQPDGPAPEVFYFPAPEQRPSALAEREWLAQRGVRVSSLDRWSSEDACYSPGWAFGALKYFAASEIAAAYQDGRLTQEDILLTDEVPAEVPHVAGIVALTRATPSSHVAILARTWGVPFAYPAAESEQARLRALQGQEVLLRAFAGFGATDVGCRLEAISMGAVVDAKTRVELKALRAPPAVEIAARTRLGALTRDAAALRPADVKYFGGKASNFGSLRRAVPESSPKALGVSFDLWESFVGQATSSGRTLQEEIDARLTGLAFPVDPRQLEPKLAELRQLIEATSFPDATVRTLLSELQGFGFEPTTKLRFRSSTNVEDGKVLSGAGLYDSYSGCLADDLDADTEGPSACDAGEAKERGALRAIRKVFGSFFNTNATIERLKHGVSEREVGMALLVHRSYPDSEEAANGVATVDVRSFGRTVLLVTQLGAESVTNPESGATPEEVSAQVYGDEVYPTLRRGSSRVPLGDKVMRWEEDYRALTALLVRATSAFLADHGESSDVVLDLEYKKTVDGRLELKQIRHLPQPSGDRELTPVLLPERVSFCTVGDERDEVLAVHRLKTRLTTSARATRLGAAELGTTLFSDTELAMLEALAPIERRGSLATYPSAKHELDAEGTVDAWTGGDGTEYRLSASFPQKLSRAELPVLATRDLRLTLLARYPKPVPSFGASSEPTTTREERVGLLPCLTARDAQPELQTRDHAGGGLSIALQYHYRRPLTGFDKTLVLATWADTTVSGLITQPIVLEGEGSRSFRPAHHNFSEDFVLDFELEAGLSADVKAQLAEQDVRLLVVKDVDRYTPANTKVFVLRRSTGALERR